MPMRWRPFRGPRWRLRVIAQELSPAIIDAGGISSSEIFGAAQLNFRIVASAITSLEAAGSPTTRFTVMPTGISSTQAFGTPGVRFTIAAASIASAGAFGSPAVAFQLAPSAIASLEAWGSARLNLRISIGGIGSSEIAGAPTVLQASPQTIGAVAIAGAETFGAAFIGDPPREQFFPPLAQGVLKVDRMPRLIPATPRPRRLGAIGIPGAEVFGEPGFSISRAPQLLAAIALQPHARAGRPAFARAPSARQLRDEQEILFDLAA
jgi:hypothetical protein